MGSTELLYWEDHHQTLVATFKNLLYENQLVDCTIAAEGQYLKAHKVVLCASSPYFQVLFTEEKENNPIVILTDIEFQELKSLIEFMYCGQVLIPEDRLKSFIDIAESLQIRGLSGDPKNEPYACQQLHSISAAVPRDENFETSQQKNVHSNSYEEHACQFAQVTSPSRKRRSFETSYQGEGNHLGETSSSPIVQSFQTTSRSYKECAEGIQTYTGNFEADITCTSPDRFVPEDNFLSNEEGSLDDVGVTKDQTTFLHLEPEVKGGEDAVKDRSFEVVLVNECGVIEEEEEYVRYEAKEENENADIDLSYDEIPNPSPNTAMNPKSSAQHSNIQDSPPISEDDYAERPRRGNTPAVHETRERFDEGDQVAQEQQEEELLGIAQAAGGKRHDCPQCAKSFPALALIRRHVRLQHSAGRLHSCNKCTKSFSSWSKLKRHMVTHIAERPYQCGVCKACFSRSDHLTVHKRKHSRERPFECDVCKACYRSRHHLTVHMRKHTGERPYQCDVCKACFSRSDHLTVHKRKHTRERSFECDVCKACFRERGDLTVHVRKHTGERP